MHLLSRFFTSHPANGSFHTVQSVKLCFSTVWKRRAAPLENTASRICAPFISNGVKRENMYHLVIMTISGFIWMSCSVLCVLWLPLTAGCCLTLCCSLMAPWCYLEKKKKNRKRKRNRLVSCPVGVFQQHGVNKTCVSSCSDLKLRVRILIDGTLIIFRVKPEDAGKYTCSPSNSLGISPSASAYLTVQCECYPGNKVEGEGRERAVRGEENSSSSMEAAVLFGSAAPPL